MMKVHFSVEAEADLDAVVDHIAGERPRAAFEWLRRTKKRCRALGDMPHIGTARWPDQPRRRMLAAGNYVVIYEVEPRQVNILRVIHAARDWGVLV